MKRKMLGGDTWIQPISSAEKFLNRIPNTNQVPIQPQQAIPGGPEVGGNIDIISSIIASLNTNPYLIGILMLLLNLGGRFLSFELTKKQEAFLQQAWLRPLIFFTVIFVATRNLAVAFWITLFFFFIIWVVANENNPFCLVPGWRKQKTVENPQSIYTSNIEYIKKVDDHYLHMHHDGGHDIAYEETQ